MIIERGRLLARHGFLFQIMMIRVSDDVDHLVELNVAKAIEIGQRFDRNVTILCGRRSPPHRNNRRIQIENVRTEEAAAAEENGSAHGRMMSPWKPLARSLGTISS